MAQHDYLLADQNGVSFLSDLNDSLAAIVSNNSGATAPSTTYAYQWWADTTTGILKQRNAANSAWVNVITIGVDIDNALGSKIDATSGVVAAGQNWAGVALSGAELTAVGIVGTSPQADIYPDGTIVGSSSNGSFTKYPNGDIECRGTSGTITSSTTAGSLYRSSSGTSMVFPIEFSSTPDIGTSTSQVGVAVGWVAGNAVSLTGINVYIISYVSGAQNIFSYIAKGR